MKGDRVEIVIDVGDGTRAYEVSEVTRTGTPVRTARFMASRIISMVEFPASDRPAADSNAA